MIRRTSPRERRGSILIVVIGLLALFAVVGLSFVLYADAEATAARSARAARNDDALPDPTIPSNDFLKQLIFGTNDNTSTLYGHDLLMSKFESGSNVPFTGVGLPAGTTTVNYTGGAKPTGKAVPWTYPDVNNFYLSWLDPSTGRVIVPSFFRKDVFGSDLAPTGTGMSDPNGYQRMLRPHPAKHPNFPKVPANPDGTFTGDVANLKFMTGNQQADSLWMYTGSPVQTWRGRQYVAMVAPLVLDLSGRVNVSVAGNNRAGGAHGSTHGFGPWEINPTYLNMTQADMTALITARNNAATVPGDRNSLGTTSLINRGHNSSNINESRATPFYSRLDVDGVGSAPDGPPTKPAAGGIFPFPDYTSRFDNAGSTAAAHASHMSMFNPFQWQRASTSTAHGFGMDDVVKFGTRYNDAKNRYQSSEINQKATGGSFASAEARTLTTAFSVSQRWGNIAVNGGTIGPIDLNRPLPDYRTDVTKPLSSTNIVSGAALTKVTQSRQNFAMDIFVRLLAVAGLIDGTNVVYNAASGGVTFGAAAPSAQVKQLAQFAVNIVDYIDGDDVMTRFQWHVDTDVVYGTELPKLVVNEAYSAMFNADADSAPPAVMMGMVKKYPAKQPAQKKFWVELHNPLKMDTTLPDSSAARLFDTNGNINCYELVIGEDAGAVGNSYSQYLGQAPENAANDPATGGITIKIRVNQFNNGTANPTLGAVERYLVEPFDGTTAVANGNKGYYVLGPADRNTNPPAAAATTFPDKQDANLTLSLVPTGGLNSMTYDSTAAGSGPTDADIATQKAKKHTVVLRRLANPYIATAAGTNPFVTVDVVEAVPSQDRVEFNDQDQRIGGMGMVMKDDAGSIGKCHPYATAPYVAGGAGVGKQALALQTSAAGTTPPHTFFLQNSNLDNANGLAWMTHLDRELVNATELLPASIYSPGLLTNKFFNGNPVAGGNAILTSNYNNHNRFTAGVYGNLLDSVLAPNLYKAFDLLSVGSRLPGIPLGGREPGLINVNAISDARVWNAVIDPQAGNTFTGAYVATAWTNLSSSRTVGATPAALADKPFQPYTSTATGASVESTLLRGLTTAASPYLFNTTPAATSSHPYFVPEPLRKIMNNTTTVTDGFLVIWTVGFFEVESVAATGPIIGKELYERVPGDLRAQYAAVVDRSMATVTPGALTTPGPKPWETKTTEDAMSGSTTITVQGTANGGQFAIYNGDSTSTPVSNGSQIRIGYGDAASGTGDGEWVTLSTFSSAMDANNVAIPGQFLLTISATSRYHAAGTRVSNGLLGNPGPQTTFDCTAPANRHLVPYYIRMQP